MTQTQRSLSQLKDSFQLMQQVLSKNNDRFHTFKNIYTQLIKSVSKFSSNINAVAELINTEIINQGIIINQTGRIMEQSILQSYNALKEILLKLSENIKTVAARQRNEVYEPLKIFSQNYKRVGNDFSAAISDNISKLVSNQQEVTRNRQTYYSSCDKLQKHKDNHAKIMLKIQSGNKSELDKFNLTTKNLLEKVSNNQKNYSDSVFKVNHEKKGTIKNIEGAMSAIFYNEQSRLQFLKKSVTNTIKVFLLLNTSLEVDIDLQNYEDKSNKSIQKKDRIDNVSFEFIRKNLTYFLNSMPQQQYVSHEELMKSKKRKEFEQQQNAIVQQLFNKIRQHDKVLMTNVITSWFDNRNPIKPTQFQALKKLCKDKVATVHPYSFYFIQIINRKMSQMTSFYCKLPEEYFQLLLQVFEDILKHLNLQTNGTAGDINIEFAHKMINISQRVMLKKPQKEYKNAVELLVHKFGKNSKKLRDLNVLVKLFGYMQRLRLKKKVADNQNKGVMGMLNKSFFSAIGMIGKKQAILTEEQVFTCLQELTHLIANFSVPSEIVLPFIKSSLPTFNEASYDYLKQIVLAKKDKQQRQKIFYLKQIKQRRQIQMKKLLQEHHQAQYCIKKTAQLGFFLQQQLYLRLVCKGLTNVHVQVLANLDIAPIKKWRYLVDINKVKAYAALRVKMAEQAKPLDVDQIITMDVNRSLHIHNEYLKPEMLTTLLRTYAHFHPKLGYCQGMNYLAGYFYIKMRDESLAYALYEWTMQQRFEHIFANGFQLLRIKMYQFQRLLSIFHLDLSEHFKRQSISSQCYIVSWIITMFTSTYQYCKQSYLVDLLWQRFISKGWPEFFRFVLWLLMHFKEELMEYNYDKCLHFFGDVNKSQLFIADRVKFKLVYPQLNVKKAMQEYHVNEQLLETLAKQHQHM